ncbi:MAG: histidine triad nucleotide-binding protein [Deltaproteobacteria bacterium]|nr:histidine triad nucleotide-binding protein [Deltaproteobacteria bacterium]
MEDCIFCKIAEGRIPSRKVYEDDNVLAFDDIHPMAPVHVIVIPKQHISTLLDVDTDTAPIMNLLTKAAQEIAMIKGIAKKGFRVVINCNEEGGQVIFHLHIHVLGGKKLKDELA